MLRNQVPALQNPTISQLSGDGWVAINTVLDESTVRDIIPKLMNSFVEGYTMGRNARCLVGLDWSTIYDRDLVSLREEWGIVEAGRFPELQQAA